METQTNASNQHGQPLEPLEATRAISLYLKSRSDELADRSLELHEKHIGSFVDWYSEKGTEGENMNDVTARTVHEFPLHIKDGFAQSTLSIYLSTVRQFVEFCESVDAVVGGVSDKIVLPDRDRNARTETLEEDQATDILSYLRKYHYASRTHALMALLWHTGIRTGTAQGLDVSDLQTKEERLRIRHRPETETPLKNTEKAERYIALSPEVTEILAVYVDENRHDVTDDHNR